MKQPICRHSAWCQNACGHGNVLVPAGTSSERPPPQTQGPPTKVGITTRTGDSMDEKICKKCFDLEIFQFFQVFPLFCQKRPVPKSWLPIVKWIFSVSFLQPPSWPRANETVPFATKHWDPYWPRSTNIPSPWPRSWVQQKQTETNPQNKAWNNQINLNPTVLQTM